MEGPPSDVNPAGYVLRRQYGGPGRPTERLLGERLRRAKNLYRKDLLAHYGCVNAIEFSAEGNLLVSGGDDRRVLLWFVPDAIYDKGLPIAMQTNHTSNIFCLAFDRLNSKIFSGGNDDQVIVHDAKTGQLILKLPHRSPVYGLSVNPQDDNVVATAGDDGRVLIFDVREYENEPNVLAKESSGFHSVVFHPLNPRLLVTSNADEGIALWDCRKTKKELIRYDENAGKVSGISACFDWTGSRVLALRRRLPPVLYETHRPNAICQFYHPQYYNSCTMKTCCFAGHDDAYILSGSDDFGLYVWRVPDGPGVEWGEPHLVLNGHRSIVNQVRYNRYNNLIASSGVEKMVKLWSTIPIGSWSGSLLKEHQDPQRNVYSKEDYVYIAGAHSQRISHDYSDQSTQEDLRMMAFFDSLIQTEIQGWNSLSEDTFTSDSDSDKQSREIARSSWESLLRCKRNAEEALKKYKPNKIAQLITQKRNKLAKMAHRKSSSLVLRYNNSSADRKNRSKKFSKFKANSTSSNYKFKKNNGVSSKNKRTTRQSSKSNNNNNNVSTTKTKNNNNNHNKTISERRCRTRSQTSASSLDAPSTSTGITGGSVVFRVVEQDSDDETGVDGMASASVPEERNLVDVIPTPLNGSRGRVYVNSTANDNVSYQSDSSMDGGSVAAVSYKCTTVTPAKSRRRGPPSEVDSGFATGSSGRAKRGLRSAEASSSSSRVNYNENSSEDEYRREKFKRRVKKARMNIRKQIGGGDSDSN